MSGNYNKMNDPSNNNDDKANHNDDDNDNDYDSSKPVSSHLKVISSDDRKYSLTEAALLPRV